MKIRGVFILLFFNILTLSLSAQSGVAKGKITDTESGNPLSGAVITGTSGGSLGTSGSDGSFSVESDAGSFTWYINLDGYEQVSLKVVIRSGETTDLGTIALVKQDYYQQDLPTITINDEFGEDGMESQAIQGILNASSDVFVSAAAYTFGPLMYRIRGYEQNYSLVTLNGFVLNDVESGAPYYSSWGGLNDVMRNTMITSGPDPIGYLFEPVGGISRIITRASEYRAGVKSVYSYSNRTYRNRAMATYSTGLQDNGWAVTGSYSYRWSERGYEPGTFYNAHSLFLAVEKKFNSRHSLNLTILDAIYSRGVAGGSTQEAYDLAGSNYYNSYWGYQDGEVRNSRVRHSNKPLFTLTHYWDPVKNLNIQTTIGYWGGKGGYTALNWYDVEDPRPDYYRKLPSYYTDAADQQSIADSWNDPSVSQVNWDYFYFANRKNTFTVNDANGIAGNSITGNRSKYIVEDRRNDISQIQLNSRAAWDLTSSLNITGGILINKYRGHNLNVIDDLLGGDYWLDIDQFAERDYPNDPLSPQSNLNILNHVVKEGDTFNSDYYSYQNDATLWATVKYKLNRFSFYLGANARYTSMWRYGNMRKGLFPDNSEGASEKVDYLTWGLKAGGDFRITGRHIIVFNAMLNTNPPLFRNVFLSPRTRNTVTPGISEEKIISGDISYVLRSPYVTSRLTGYYTRFNNQTEVTSFYHDDWRTLVNYAMAGINKENYGIEFGADIKLSTTLTLSPVVSVGQYMYVNNPSITITKDNNSEVLSNEEVWIKYFRTSGTPQTALALSIEYRAPRFWWAGITGSWYDHIYLDFNPVTRTKDDYGYYPWWEPPRKMPSDYLIDIFAGKSWKINNIYIVFSANISNVMNNKSLVSGGFEQYRFDPEYPDLFQPKLYYYNGFNYFLNLSVRM
ncbi:MAG: TonB-dependent receptor [Bacteroidales bacterium]